MAKSYEQMTKAELLKAIGFFKLEGKVAELGKDENSLINADYVKVLNAFRDSQAALNGAEDTNTNTNASTTLSHLDGSTRTLQLPRKKPQRLQRHLAHRGQPLVWRNLLSEQLCGPHL